MFRDKFLVPIIVVVLTAFIGVSVFASTHSEQDNDQTSETNDILGYDDGNGEWPSGLYHASSQNSESYNDPPVNQGTTLAAQKVPANSRLSSNHEDANSDGTKLELENNPVVSSVSKPYPITPPEITDPPKATYPEPFPIINPDPLFLPITEPKPIPLPVPCTCPANPNIECLDLSRTDVYEC